MTIYEKLEPYTKKPDPDMDCSTCSWPMDFEYSSQSFYCPLCHDLVCRYPVDLDEETEFEINFRNLVNDWRLTYVND